MNAEETVQALHKTAEMMMDAATSLERGETQAKQLADARLRLDHHERCWARIERALPPDPNLAPDSAPLVERVLYRLEQNEKLRAEISHTNDYIEREHIAAWKQIQAVLPEKPDEKDSSLVEDVIECIETLRRENQMLVQKCEALKGEITTLGNHAICRLNLLGDIHRVLGSDGGETGACMLTGVSPELYRLPKRIENLRRENETLARNMPPEPPAEPQGSTLEYGDGSGYVRQATDSTDAAALRLVGHQWYRTKQHDFLPSLTVHIAYPEANLVLCAVYQNVVTGALTHTPVLISDLDVL
jgi:hypothetical protein